MIRTCNKIIILSIFFFLKLQNYSTNCEYCDPSSCLKDGIPIGVSVRYPFRIKNEQPKSCGLPGFNVHCDNTLGTLIKLQNDVVLGVEGILYNTQEIVLSDPYNNCIPQKLLSLDLKKTRFNPHGITKKFWLYNCSGIDDKLTDYDPIECLSGSDYTVISAERDVMKNVGVRLNCTLLKILNNVPVSYTPTMQLSSISSLHLNWDGSIVPPEPARKDSIKSGFSSLPPKVGLALCILGVLMAIIIGCCRYRIHSDEQATSTVSPNINTMASTEDTGLDKITIDSYPMVVIGESGRLIKDDNICSICLSDYRPLETLKILPECLHRFHVDCIDQWLCSKGVCPICRHSPPRASLQS